MQAISPHLRFDEKILVLLTPKAIHLIRLISSAATKWHCGTLPVSRTAKSAVDTA